MARPALAYQVTVLQPLPVPPAAHSLPAVRILLCAPPPAQKFLLQKGLPALLGNIVLFPVPSLTAQSPRVLCCRPGLQEPA